MSTFSESFGLVIFFQSLNVSTGPAYITSVKAIQLQNWGVLIKNRPTPEYIELNVNL